MFMEVFKSYIPLVLCMKRKGVKFQWTEQHSFYFRTLCCAGTVPTALTSALSRWFQVITNEIELSIARNWDNYPPTVFNSHDSIAMSRNYVFFCRFRALASQFLKVKCFEVEEKEKYIFLSIDTYLQIKD